MAIKNTYADDTNVSDESQHHVPKPTDRVIDPHGVIGVDAEGRIHHYDSGAGRDFVFQDGGRIYVIDPETGLEHVENLGSETIDTWSTFVELKLCGWETNNVLGVQMGRVERVLADNKGGRQ